MGKTTGIAWCDHTFNPWWGCARVSQGCVHCYAEQLAVVRGGLPIWGYGQPDREVDKQSRIVKGRRLWRHDSKHWQEPIVWNAAAREAGQRRRVFCASMADVFEDHPVLASERAKLFELINVTPMLDWLLLTKRPENVVAMYGESFSAIPWNVWVGTSVEDMLVYDRIETLCTVPAAIRWLSVEPMIGPVILKERDLAWVDWVIIGGESGPGHRPMDAAWARALRDQCIGVGTALFFKQWGGATPKSGGDTLDGRQWHQYPRDRFAREGRDALV